MKRKRNSNNEEIAIDNILKELSCCFEATYTELLETLGSKSSYKRLRKIGEQQFFSAPESSSSIKERSQEIKMQFAEINLLAVSADNIIDTVISEKFQSNFLITLKEEVLKIILNLYSDQDSSISEKSKNAQSSQPTMNPTEGKNIEDVKVVLEKLKDMSKYFAQNLDDISKQVIEMPLENTIDAAENTKTVHSSIKKEDNEELDNNDRDNLELGNISIDSVSSVHTSDLSSFNDDISLSSNEDTGEKGRKLSFKMAQEEVLILREQRKQGKSDIKQEVKNIKSEDLESEVSTNDSFSSSQMSFPQRVRKPNSKYNVYDLVTPFKNKTEKYASNRKSTFAQESETIIYLPRKRGRPKKNVSL